MKSYKVNIDLRDGKSHLGKDQAPNPDAVRGCFGFRNEDKTITYIPIDLIKEINFYEE